MVWTLVGYFPKRRVTRSRWVSPYPDHPEAGFPAPAPVEEICSVSNCIAAGPDLPSDNWPCNAFGGFDDPTQAWLAIAADLRRDFDMFAYRLVPMLFRDGQAEPLEIAPLDVEPLPDTFERLGYDAVELTQGRFWGCSPLSCNGQAGEAGASVNRHCLIASESEVLDLARSFSVSKPEPGPYCVVEVWRDASPAADPNTTPHR